nr:non-ribosomal peptide synthetase/type I polyketide synthase [uncultured Desulfobulbus sp.]
MGKKWELCFGADLLPSTRQTLRDAFLHAAQGEGTLTRIDANEEEHCVSYKELRRRSARIAGQLTAAGIRPGDAVILLMEDPLAFACGFWACILGGFVAVPLPPMDTPAQRERTIGAMEVLQNPWVVSDTVLTDDDAIDALIRGRWTITGPNYDRIENVSDAPEPSPACKAEDSVIIQFSSGSTGRPKGVQLRHNEVWANMVALTDRLMLTPKDTFVSWLPLSHDFGLFHFHILPMVTGINQVLMAAPTFARKPVSWIRAMDKHKATISGAPDFALRLITTVMKPKRAAQFDLSSVRQISNGAEPISARTIGDFLAAMQPTKLNPLSLKPAYGLAEATLVVTMATPGSDIRTLHIDRTNLAIGAMVAQLAADDPRSMPLVALGPPLKKVEVRIADNDGNILAENLIGRIQVRSPAVMQGYINNPQATQEALLAENWLDTGDIGFMDQDELIASCRAKELIIVHGVNYYPMDIELAAESTPGLSWTNTLAITQARKPDGDGEAVVVFVRYRGSDEEFASIAWKIEETILEKTGLAIDYCIAVRNIPKTTSGKIQRFELGNRFTSGEFDPQIETTRQIQIDKGEPLATAIRLGNTALAARLIANEAERLTSSSINQIDPLMEQGMSSLHTVALCQRLATMTGRALTIADIFDHPCAHDLAAFLTNNTKEQPEEAVALSNSPSMEIAVIGYGCRFPGGANDPEAFWQLLESNTDDITIPIPSDRWCKNDSQDGIPERAAFLDDIDSFDHAFFTLPATEARTLDPRQRLLLDVVWQSLEHAGLDPEQLRGRRVGLFIGLSESGVPVGDTRLIADEAAARTYGLTSNATSIAVGRLAHIFDFRGPALAIDTACSSSLVATNLAMQALRSGECELAIAGGANLLLSPDLHAALAHMGTLSTDGRCKTFSAEADGYGRGEGAGMIVLKGYDQARGDGDCIHGILIGYAQNHDGASQTITAPNGQAQRQLLRRALLAADLGSRDVDWIETHGTGTPLGDPIEVTALMDVFPRKGADTLPLGAVKSRIGHLEAAAGIAGIIKVLLALAHQRIPKNSPAQVANPNVLWEDIGARPVNEALAWPIRPGHRRIVGVSAFGMSGTNAHLLIGEAPPPVSLQLEQDSNPPILAIGARNADALAQLQATWEEILSHREAGQWNGLLAGSCNRRGGHSYRLALPLDPTFREKSLERLHSAQGRQAAARSVILFAFTGQGAQSPGMLADVYLKQPVFRAAVDEAAAFAGPIAGRLLNDWLYGEHRADQKRMDQTDLAQPALVATAWGLVRLLAEWGIRPEGVIGHSSGEITAALVAGAIDLETAMRFAALRGEVMQSQAPAGNMLAISGSASTISPLIEGLDNTVIAGFNGPESITLSGSTGEIETVVRRCLDAGIKTRLLTTLQAFHSPTMGTAAEKLTERCAALATHPLGLPMFSTLTGGALQEDALMDMKYWQEQMMAPVRFSQAAAAAGQAGFNLMLEIGPRPLLSRLGPASVPEATWLAGYDPEDGEGLVPLASALARVWQAGSKVDWRRYYGHRGLSGDSLPRHPLTPQAIPRLSWENLHTSVSTPQPTTAAPSPAPSHSPEDVLARTVVPLFARVSGRKEKEINAKQSFLAHGLDSLVIVQLKHAVKTEIGLDIPVAEFYDGTETPLRLAERLHKNLPQEPEQGPPVAIAAVPSSEAIAADETSIAALMRAQLQTVQDVINRQLETLSASGMNTPVQAVIPSPASPKPTPKTSGGEIKGLFAQPNKQSKGLRPEQLAHIARLATTWNTKSAGSKKEATANRLHVANSRSVFGFRQEYKELTYPLVANRAQGSKICDVDGNEYIDITMGFGVYLFGHNPPFIKEALLSELEQGAAIGPMSPLAGEVAERIHQLTGVERCAFFSTGTEAIMCAVRLARAVTGRTRLVIFKGAYHGSFDGVLATGWLNAQGKPETIPMTDGTPEAMVDSLIVLDYGDMNGLDVIDQYAEEIALVLVEPVQSRNPGNLPIDFLHALRRLTLERDIPLLFDEIISGFRFAPGGMQALLGIEADIVTYGKVLGHGQPFGVVAGKARFMDAVDGGQWSYGDDSAPGVRTAFVAGTFNGHPLSLAAARTVLERIATDNGALQEDLAAKNEAMCQRLDQLFRQENVPVHMERYGSLFRFGFGEETEILNTHLLNNGIFVWEQRNCFLSTAHTQEDIEKIIHATKRSIAAMKREGWFPGNQQTSPPEDNSPFLSTSRAQKAMWHQAQSPAAQGLWTDMIALDLNGTIQEEQLHKAVERVVDRHPALSTVLLSETSQVCAKQARTGLTWLDFSLAIDPESDLRQWLETSLRRPFEPFLAPIRLYAARLETMRTTLIVLGHHLCFDGWSLALIIREILTAYQGTSLPAPDRLETYLHWEEFAQPTAGALAPVAMQLPGAQHRTTSIAPAGSRITRTDLRQLRAALKTRGQEGETTGFILMLAAYAIFLSQLLQQRVITIGLPCAGQAAAGTHTLVGNVSFIRPLTLELDPQERLDDFLKRLQRQVVAEASSLPQESLPHPHVLFNLDGPLQLAVTGLEIGVRPVPIVGARADLFVNLLIVNDQLVLDVDWPKEKFSADQISSWTDSFLLLAQLLCSPEAGDKTVGTIGSASPIRHPTDKLSDWLGEADALGLQCPPIQREKSAKPVGLRTPTEQRLANLWQDLLNTTIKSAEDDFFASGGGSLAGVRLLAAIENSFAVTLRLTDIFTAPGLAEMASLIDSRETGGTSLLAAGDRSTAPVSPQQRRLWFLEQLEETSAAYNITIALDFLWRLDHETLKVALSSLAARHDSLRTAITVRDEIPVQMIAERVKPHMTVKDLRNEANWSELRDNLLKAAATTTISLDQLPLWRVLLLQLPQGDCLALTIHHSISDVWSIEVLLRDLLDAYRSACLGIAPLQAKLPLQYGDYCRWLATSAAPDQQKALAYWIHNLSGAPHLTTFPPDYPRPLVKSFAGARALTLIDGEQLVKLRSLVRQQRSSLFQAVMAAVAVVTSQRSGQDDLVLGTVSGSRNHPGLEDIVGLFANTLPVRFSMQENQSLGDLLQTTRDRLLAATVHDLASLDDIIGALALPRRGDSNPLFEICVTHDDRRGILRIATEHGAVCEEVVTPTTQFDFSLYVTETDDALLLEVTYATALYEQATVKSILSDIVTTLARLTIDPNHPLVPLTTEPLPSPHQERLWFVDRFENGQLYANAPFYYNMALVREIEQPLQPTELEHRLNAVAQVLPLLNRTMNMEGELPSFKKQPPASQAVFEARQSIHFPPDLNNELASFIEKPFDLSRDLLLRAGIFTQENGGQLLVLVAHHIVLDFWSLNEIARLLLAGTLPGKFAQQFDPFAKSSRRPATAWPEDLRYWRQQLAGELPRLLLPMDRPRPAIHTFTLGLANARLSTEETRSLHTWAQTRSLSFDDLLLAAFVALLQRLSRQDTIVLGTTAPSQLEHERSLIGPVTNLVTLQITCDTSLQIATFIKQIAEHSHEALLHSAIPFDTVVLDLKPKNDMSRTALFDVLYVRDDGSANDALLPPALGWGKYDLTLASNGDASGPRNLALAFNQDILDQQTAQHWLDILVVLLRGLTEASTLPVADWPLLTPALQQQLIETAQSRQQEATYAANSLPEAFAAQVAQTPDAIALIDGARRLSYREMEQQANRIANRLLSSGIGQEDRVAILLPRSLDWPIAMLGVLKAGAAFVPLDPHTAVERGQIILATAAVKALVIDDSIDDKLIPPNLLLVNLSGEALAQESALSPQIPLHDHLLAYVLFTSGSTGTPKGVMIEHHNVLALILGQGALFNFAKDEVWSWFHSPAFDFSIWEIWGPLLTGGRLVVVPESAQGDMAELRALLHQERITLLSLTPSAISALLAYEEEHPRANLAVRSLWLGGEALTPSKLKGWAARYPSCRLLNLYGITETTVHVTFRELSPADLGRGDSLIGRALPSYSVTIRDTQLRPVPVGVAGEIVVGGSGVARGYLGQAQLSAERFVDDPLAPGNRVYRSGDLARTTLDGELVYLGRIDEQIKLRGFRIEPGEIENSLMQLPGVRAAVVGTIPGADGKADKVVAWLVTATPPDPDEAANHLARTLPAYMIPAHVYLVDTIPLTANGKADRRQLSTMCTTPLGRNENGSAPKPGLEQKIASIWCNLLAIEQVGREDNFFALGGHSLKANQAVLRIRRTLGLDLTLKDFFSAQSIAALAALVKDKKSPTDRELAAAPSLDAYPLSSPQRRLFALQLADPKTVAYNMVGGFIITGQLDPARLAQAFVHLRERHEILRTRFCLVNGQPAQLIDPPEQSFFLPLTHPRSEGPEEKTISRLLAAEFNHVFDLSQGQLLRARLVSLHPSPEGEPRALLVLNMHHIIADGWSVAVLMENLAHFYDQTPPALPPLPRQYKDFAYWQSQAFSEGTTPTEHTFWQNRLSNHTGETTIPVDFPRPEHRSGKGAMVRYTLSETTSTAMRQVTAQMGTTLFAAFSALVHALLHIRSGAAQTIIGTADAGRDMLEVEDQVGFYLNLIPFPLACDLAAPLSQWLLAAKEEAVAVLAQKSYPFDLLIEQLEITTAPGHSPLFDVLLLLQNNATPSGQFADLHIESLADQTVSAKYDLNLMVEDRPAIELILEYDTTLFRRETAQWFLDDLTCLVEALAGKEDLSPIQVLQAAAQQPIIEAVGMLDNDDPLLGME